MKKGAITSGALARQHGLREVSVRMGLFDYTVVAILGPEKGVQPYLQWKHEDPDFALAPLGRGACFYRAGVVPVIWIPRYPCTPREYATLAHEALHAVCHMLAWASVPMTTDTEEVVAHALGHIVNVVLEEGR